MWPLALTIEKVIHDSKNPYKISTSSIRYDNVTLSPLLLQRGLRIGPIQRNGAAPSDSHRAFFCPNSVEVVGKINGGE
jgi:hypothetical protein